MKTGNFEDEFEIKNNVLISYNGNDSEVTVPSGITEIADNAFSKSCSKIRKIFIPESVVHFDFENLSGFDSLKSVVFLTSNLDELLKSNHYEVLRSDLIPTDLGILLLSKREYPNIIKLLKSNTDENGFIIKNNELIAYRGYSRCVSVPEGVERINDGAFYLCSFIKELQIPKSVKAIGKYAFNGCIGVENISFMADDITCINELKANLGDKSTTPLSVKIPFIPRDCKMHFPNIK